MKRRGVVSIAMALLLVGGSNVAVHATGSGPHGHTGPGGTVQEDDADAGQDELERSDPSGRLAELDASGVVSDGSGQTHRKNLALRGRGERLDENATTDVWSHDGFAYTGTFNSPCGGEDEAGVWVWDVHNVHEPEHVDIIPSPEGSRSNDVKVDTLNSGTVLAHSNEPCADGPGGIELYDVDDPTDARHLSSIRADEINPISDDLFGGVNDVGVHNIWLFSQGSKDYAAIVAESVFDTFRVFDITDPTEPEMVSAWGAEEVFDPGVGDETEDTDRVLDAALWLLDGFGDSRNRFLHDITISADGTRAYLSNWDAGLVLLDIADPSDPQVVSVALDAENGSLDGEVNSHAAWPSEDGSIVVETEEDFDAWANRPPTNLTFGEGDPPAPLPGVALSTLAGDEFEGAQTGNESTVDADSVTVESGPLEGTTFPAAELAGDQPKFSDVGTLSGEAVWIGRACDGDEILNADAIDEGDIAVVRRGACTFREKNVNADAAGAAAVVITNNVPSSEWGGVRIWDYSDPANPELASTFDTACSAAAEPVPGCDPFGTYSVHNIVVETTDEGRVQAYISWYRDGMLVLDITDPSNPVEVARFFDESEEFVASNGGLPHDFWGVWKEPGEPWVYGSDRNGGLYIFQELGRGTVGKR
ncbi:hypothetical protein H0B56_06135 [Haloechinothrix sp. YIM 98757]|uniref:PA domain-containing protein n=1 Tax=Haloechinothrix aidingensis TaxID=2752311 RepID=A0A837ZWV4_9PSEU|nr:PA domain-containing protein [Haloechinothrix aidingensis]MBA0125116.1 hypothetical protein [Haloechinothrix aidingensis]